PHVSSGVRSAGCNLIATLVFGMSETIAITGKSVKLFKGHYTSKLSDLGDRSETSGKSRTAFRSFEANSAFYLTKMIGKMDRFPTAVVDSS
ncbi:MAG: hypothetical protein ACREYE_13580, partial [Gammaproteobacteria bacterium]